MCMFFRSHAFSIATLCCRAPLAQGVACQKGSASFCSAGDVSFATLRVVQASMRDGNAAVIVGCSARSSELVLRHTASLHFAQCRAPSSLQAVLKRHDTLSHFDKHTFSFRQGRRQVHVLRHMAAGYEHMRSVRLAAADLVWFRSGLGDPNERETSGA